METGCHLALLCGVLHVNGPRPGPSPALRVELGCVTVLARAEHREIRRAQPCPRGPARHTPPALPTSSCQGRKQNGLSDKPQARATGRRAGKGSAERARLDSVAHSSPFPPRGQQAPHVSGGSEKQRVCAPAFSSDQRALSAARSCPFIYCRWMSGVKAAQLKPGGEDEGTSGTAPPARKAHRLRPFPPRQTCSTNYEAGTGRCSGECQAFNAASVCACSFQQTQSLPDRLCSAGAE